MPDTYLGNEKMEGLRRTLELMNAICKTNVNPDEIIANLKGDNKIEESKIRELGDMLANVKKQIDLDIVLNLEKYLK